MKLNHATAASTTKFTRLKPTILLLLIYLALALFLTWPTAAQLTTHLPGDGGDDPAIAWNLWWTRYALLNLGQSPFDTDFMFYPIGINLAFYTLTILNALLVLPLTLNVGVVTASNLHLLLTFVLSGYGTFLLARTILTTSLPVIGQTQSGHRAIWLSAALAGAMYAFAGSKSFYAALGQFNIASSHWIPWAVLYIFRSYRQPHSLKNPLLAALFLIFQAWAEMTYASFLLVFLGIFWLYHLVDSITKQRTLSTRSSLGLHLRNGGLLLAVFLLGISPILAAMLPDLQAEGDFLVEGGGFADAFSADLLGFFVPTMLHPFFGHLISLTGIGAQEIGGYTKGQHVYLGLTLTLLAIVATVAFWRLASVRFWLFSTVIFLLLCLGPIIAVNGHSTDLPGPFTLFQYLPFFRGNRYPSRYSVMLFLSLSVLTSFGLVWLSCQLRTRWGNKRAIAFVPLLAGGLFLFEHLSVPLPQSDMRLPAVYRPIIADPQLATVLDIPFAWRNGFRITGALTTEFMFGQFYQTAHQKHLLQGNTSRNPAFKFDYFTRAPVINSLLALETGRRLPPGQQAADRAIAAEVVRFFNIKYLVIRPYQYDRFNGMQNERVTQDAVAAYIESTLPVEKIYHQGQTRLYRTAIDLDPVPTIRADTTHPLTPLYLGEGWGWLTPGQPLTAQRRQVRLLLPLTDQAQQLSLTMRLPEAVPDETRPLYVSLNGWRSEPQLISHRWQALVFDLPAGVAQTGLNDVFLNFDAVTQLPAPPNGPTIDVTAISAGEEVGGYAHIYVNGHDLSPNQRGYNTAVINQETGSLVTQVYDTHLQPEASQRIVIEFGLTALPKARPIIAVAAADEASLNLGEAAVSTWQSLGTSGNLRGCFRCSHAFIIEAGQSPPQVMEALSAIRPVGVTTGLGLTEPTIAAQLQRIDLH